MALSCLYRTLAPKRSIRASKKAVLLPKLKAWHLFLRQKNSTFRSFGDGL